MQIFYHRPVAANGRRARRPSKGKTAIGLNVGRIIEALGFRHGGKGAGHDGHDLCRTAPH